MRRKPKPFPKILLVEWVSGPTVRLFFSTGRVLETDLPVRSAKKAHVVYGGVGLDIGDGREMSGATLHGQRGRTWSLFPKRARHRRS